MSVAHSSRLSRGLFHLFQTLANYLLPAISVPERFPGLCQPLSFGHFCSRSFPDPWQPLASSNFCSRTFPDPWQPLAPCQFYSRTFPDPWQPPPSFQALLHNSDFKTRTNPRTCMSLRAVGEDDTKTYLISSCQGFSSDILESLSQTFCWNEKISDISVCFEHSLRYTSTDFSLELFTGTRGSEHCLSFHVFFRLQALCWNQRSRTPHFCPSSAILPELLAKR